MRAVIPAQCALLPCHWRASGEVFYAHSNEDGEPYGLSTAALYAELTKLPAARSLKMTYVRVGPDGENDLYKLWQRECGVSDADK